jgi:hypothetical protein
LVFSSCEKILYEIGVPPRGYDTKDFVLSSFDRVELNNAFFVTIVKSTESKISAKGSGDDIDDLEVTVTNGKLDIRYDKRIRIKQDISGFILIPYDLFFTQNISEINSHDYEFWSYSNDLIPSYCENIDGKASWKNIMSNGVYDESSEIKDGIVFTNGSVYINKRINIHVRRQDPFGTYGLKSRTFPSDPYGETIPEYVQNNTFKTPNVIC